MITVSAAAFQQNFELYQDKALTEPVAITRNGRACLVMMSTEDYHRLQHRSREGLQVDPLSDMDIDAIAKIEMEQRQQDPELK